MKLKKTLIIIGSCFIFFIVRFNSCEIGPKIYIYDNQYKIANPQDRCTYISRSGKDDSYNKINFDYIGFTGKDTIWNLEVKEASEIIFKYNSEICNGDFKGVLVSDKKKIDNIFESSTIGEKSLKLEKGNYAFKIVGRNAKGKIKVFINGNENIKIKKED